MKFTISMESQSLKNEIQKYFGYTTDCPSTASFNQRRAQISAEAFQSLFTSFTAKYSKNQNLFKGYRLIACDGSDINLAHNPDDKESYFTNGNAHFAIWQSDIPEYEKRSLLLKSPHTVTACRDALNVYMAFLQSEKGIKFRDVTANGFRRDNIVSFMEWLGSARGNEVTTVNQRLSHIRSFCKYMTKNDVLSAAGYEEIRDISDYKDTRTPDFVWLSIDEVKLMLSQPVIRKKNGVRDRFFLSLMYESGCRDDEILHLRVKDFAVNKNGEADLHIFGKGNKHRCTPISSDINPYYKEYCAIYHPDLDLEKEELLFYTDRKGIRAQMSDDCMAKFLKKYEGSARNINPEIPHQHPHLWCRTCAMHLYLAGVPLPLVSEWLGHSDEATTRVYARATDEMKRQAQRKLSENSNSVFKDDVPFKYADDEEALKKLCGLK